MKSKCIWAVTAAASLAFAASMISCSTTSDALPEVPAMTNEEIAELTSVQLANRMGNGINLGNTMEAYGHNTPGTGASVSSYETLWGQPVTTKAMIDGMRDAGFDSIRIPTAWTNTMNYESGDYTIRQDYLDRVGEIATWAIEDGMFVIINDHWDGSWWGMFGSATQETRDKAMELYKAMWSQIADYFKDYSYYLIFESANEELGSRLNDTDVAKDSGTLSADECYETMNTINQAFVDLIRSTGGNNPNRFLLIAGHDTDIGETCDDRFKMPTDSASNKLLVSVHFYEPSPYCIGESDTQWGSKSHYESMNNSLARMDKFNDAGYGVIIGEYGVGLAPDGAEKNGAMKWFSNFLYNCDLYGYAPVLWDTNAHYSKSSRKIVDSELANIYKTRSYASEIGKSRSAIESAAQKAIDDALAAAPETLTESSVDMDKPFAWLMFTSSDWNLTYSVGDVYDPDTLPEGAKATVTQINGAGSYTVGLDFSGTANGYANSVAFSALGMMHGEETYPGCVLEIDEVIINGESYTLTGKPYTSSDDGKCTRVNLYNQWVSKAPDDARVSSGSASDASPQVLDPKADALAQIKTIVVNFTLKTN